jgi:hypothetical protein
MKRNGIFIVSVTVFVLLVVLVAYGQEKKASAEKMFYICADPKTPCITDNPDACKDCPAGLAPKKYVLGTLMGYMKNLTKNLGAAVEKMNVDLIARQAESIIFISTKIPEFPPQINAEQKDKFRELSAKIGNHGKELSAASKLKDAQKIKIAYAEFTNTCDACHQMFKK